MLDLRNRGIIRGRMFLGALLLLAAVLTWSIGFMMSPHGETVAKGTEHVRATIVTFKRNGAVGTLILCALAGLLLFPLRRPKWPLRDWALVGVLALLAGNSVYTLAVLPSVDATKTQTSTETTSDWNAIAVAPDVSTTNIAVAPPPEFNQFAVPRSIIATKAEAKNPRKVDEAEPSEEASRGLSDDTDTPAFLNNGDDTAINEADEIGTNPHTGRAL